MNETIEVVAERLADLTACKVGAVLDDGLRTIVIMPGGKIEAWGHGLLILAVQRKVTIQTRPDSVDVDS